ncbi:hypothetical protein MmTuc01_1985 [Methanosarcina mazei Tuc01]|uniref:Uncharacterized protein n=1 Tax=Methanosarcina mazei Tuc01 TaxID=1236903 RepID=M1QAR8_METMZ|nr:hypothetical protein MmTuc01_1985 [Methanosarcina mazei Tuc01]
MNINKKKGFFHTASEAVNNDIFDGFLTGFLINSHFYA